jgi:hypothetical protein
MMHCPEIVSVKDILVEHYTRDGGYMKCISGFLFDSIDELVIAPVNLRFGTGAGL